MLRSTLRTSSVAPVCIPVLLHFSSAFTPFVTTGVYLSTIDLKNIPVTPHCHDPFFGRSAMLSGALVPTCDDGMCVKINYTERASGSLHPLELQHWRNVQERTTSCVFVFLSRAASSSRDAFASLAALVKGTGARAIRICAMALPGTHHHWEDFSFCRYCVRFCEIEASRDLLITSMTCGTCFLFELVSVKRINRCAKMCCVSSALLTTLDLSSGGN